MARALLQLTSPPLPKSRFDPAVAALPLLRTLAERLRLAMQFADLVDAASPVNGEPELFFFHGPTPSVPAFADSPDAVRAARKRPDLAEAWASLSELLDDAFTLAAADAQVRHAARAIPRLRPRMQSIAAHHDRCRQFAELLNGVDDEVAVVLEPHTGRGWRVMVRGVHDLGQFHMLFADLVPGYRPDPALSDAYRFEPAAGPATAVVQFHAPAALRADGSLPLAFEGHPHWLWESQAFRDMPQARGERLMLIGPPAYPRQWPARRRYAAVEGAVEMLQVLNPDAVAVRLRSMGSTVQSRPIARAA